MDAKLSAFLTFLFNYGFFKKSKGVVEFPKQKNPVVIYTQILGRH